MMLVELEEFVESTKFVEFIEFIELKEFRNSERDVQLYFNIFEYLINLFL